jgi:hypothetical protein
MTFHEVTCRSALNKVPDASRMPFRWRAGHEHPGRTPVAPPPEQAPAQLALL